MRPSKDDPEPDLKLLFWFSESPRRGSRAVNRATIRGTRTEIHRKVAACTRQRLELGGQYSGATTSSGTRTRGRPKLDCNDLIVGRPWLLLCHVVPFSVIPARMPCSPKKTRLSALPSTVGDTRFAS